MGPVAVMLHEHDLGRRYVAALESATERYAAGNRDAVKDIIENALGFAETLRQHIHKEDMILYPMAQSALGEMGIHLMQSDFERIEQEKRGIEDKYLELLAQLETETVRVGS
jgi:hemerythrin-like domain-containing protein